MDGITKGRLTGMEILVGFDVRLKERGGKEKLVKGALFDFFHIFFVWIERNDDNDFFSSPVSCTSSSSSSSLLYRFSV